MSVRYQVVTRWEDQQHVQNFPGGMMTVAEVEDAIASGILGVGYPEGVTLSWQRTADPGGRLCIEVVMHEVD